MKRTFFTLSAGLSLFLATANAQTAAPPPSDAEVVASRARALDGRGRPDLAAQTWRQVLLVDPNHQEALAALARAAKQAGNTAESDSYLARLRKLNPNHPALQQVQSMRVLTQQQARLREAERLASIQQFDRALQVYREVYGDDPPEGGQAIAYYETQAAVPGGWEPATAALKNLSDKYPQSEDYRLSLGKLLTYRPASRMNGLRLLESIKNNSDLTGKARVAWRQALVWEESNPQFAPSLRAYLTRYPDPELQRALTGMGRPAQPIAPQTGLARTPVENAGYAALSGNNLAEAEAQFSKELAEGQETAGALAGMGFVRMKQENFDAAIEYFDKALKLSPQDALVSESLQSSKFFKAMKDATSAFNADRLDAAAAHYRKALELRPDATDAMQGLAGSLAKAGDWGAAMPVYESLTRVRPQDEGAWVGLLTSRYRVAGADSLLASAKQLPDTMRLSLARNNLEYLALLAVANSETGNNTVAKQNLQQAVELANTRALPLSTAQEMQFGGLFLRLGYPVESATVFERVTASDPENVNAWEGLAAAYVQLHQEAQASRALARMPAGVTQKMMNRPGFLRSLAAIEMTLNRLDTAREYLRRSVEIDSAGHTPENIAAQLQLAHILLRQGDAAQAESVLRSMAAMYPENPDVWKALIAALHQEGRDDLALDAARRVPAAPGLVLQDDADYVSLLASVEDLLTHYDSALRLARRAADLLARNRREIPADLSIQTAWLILKTGSDERELLAMLQTLSTRSDLSPQQIQGVNVIWSSWSLQRANAAVAAEEYPRAIGILETAMQILPKDPAIRSTLAGVHLKAGSQVKALGVYKAWGMTGATASDYAGAIGAAIATEDKTSSNEWIHTALESWPNHPTILKLAGQLAAASGNFQKAEEYWRAALVAVPEQTAQTRVAQDAAIRSTVPLSDDPRKAMGDLLLGNDGSRPAQNLAILPSLPNILETPKPAGEVKPSTPDRMVLPAPPASAQPTVPIFEKRPLRPLSPRRNVAQNQVRFVLAQNQTQPSPRPAPAATGTNQPPTPPADEQLRGELQERIAAIEARNTPFFGFGGMVRARSGERGFERLLIQESTLEASAVIKNTVRLQVIARPTYLDDGSSDGLSSKRFGLAPVGTIFESQAVGGIGGEVQLSTQTFGLRAGGTPQDFLVPNAIGGIRFRPGNGPIQIIAERETIKDSLLAYAGARDPISNRVWGGVVSTGASVQGNFGGQRSGFYGSFGYQVITGKEVERNTRVDGNMGGYWQLFSNSEGALTAGFNIFGMRYDKNLRFYTFGHGGYFSPQRYFLLNFPFEWRGVYQRKVQYLVNGGVGSQHFQENESPFFPTQPSLQTRSGPVYPKRTSTGANYNMDARVAYQVSPKWHLGAYANLNNARDYSAQSVGIYVRFSTKARAVSQDLGLPSVPDWRGVDPFGLP